MEELLTGKCKTDFILWFTENLNNELDLTIPDDFFNYPINIKFGVFVDFFNSEDIFITIRNSIDFLLIEINYKDYYIEVQTMKEARTEAIKKAVELYNKI